MLKLTLGLVLVAEGRCDGLEPLVVGIGPWLARRWHPALFEGLLEERLEGLVDEVALVDRADLEEVLRGLPDLRLGRRPGC